MGDTTVQPGTQPTTQQGDPAGQNTAPNQSTNGNGQSATADEPLGDAGVKALHEERAARKAEAEARKALEKRLDALKPFEEIAAKFGDGDAKKGTSELQQLTERHAQLEKDIRDERDARWRAELAHEHGLTAAQAKRLMGSTRDEMAADAAEMVKEFGIDAKREQTAKNGARPKPDRSQGGGQSATPSAKDQANAQLEKRFGKKTTT